MAPPKGAARGDGTGRFAAAIRNPTGRPRKVRHIARKKKEPTPEPEDSDTDAQPDRLSTQHLELTADAIEDMQYRLALAGQPLDDNGPCPGCESDEEGQPLFLKANAGWKAKGGWRLVAWGVPLARIAEWFENEVSVWVQSMNFGCD